MPLHSKKQIGFTLNGEHVEVAFAPHKTLLEVLREDLNLTGTKHGCELGECGTCAVLVDQSGPHGHPGDRTFQPSPSSGVNP